MFSWPFQFVCALQVFQLKLGINFSRVLMTCHFILFDFIAAIACGESRNHKAELLPSAQIRVSLTHRYL
jgi:hypothetical protein